MEHLIGIRKEDEYNKILAQHCFVSYEIHTLHLMRVRSWKKKSVSVHFIAMRGETAIFQKCCAKFFRNESDKMESTAGAKVASNLTNFFLFSLTILVCLALGNIKTIQFSAEGLNYRIRSATSQARANKLFGKSIDIISHSVTNSHLNNAIKSTPRKCRTYS